MSATQVVSSLIASTNIESTRSSVAAPSFKPSTKNKETINASQQPPLTSTLHQRHSQAAPASQVTRVVTKESLQETAEDFGYRACSPTPITSIHNGNGVRGSDDCSFHSTLFDFSILEPESKEAELLNLPLSTIELPLTPPPPADANESGFDSDNNNYITPCTTVSVSTESSSSLLSTAAAIAASQQGVASSIAAPPIVSVTAPTPAPSSAVVPKLKPKKAAKKSSGSSSPKLPQPRRRVASMEQSQPQAQRMSPVPPAGTATAAIHRIPQATAAGGQPLPKKYAAAAPAPNATMVAVAPAYHHAHATHQAAPRARAPSTASSAAAPNTAAAANTVSAIHPSTGQVENTGRWTAEEHRLFLQGLEQHGKGWKKIATLIKSRTVVQIRTHAQKYFQKLAKARQNGESVAGVGMGTVGGAVVTTGGAAPVHIGTAEGGELGIAIPVGPDGQPVVTMRTTTHPNSSVSSHVGNMSLGTDPASLAAAGGAVISTATGAVPRGGARKRRGAAPGGGTKRRAIGNVVRSAVREGRNVKRQKIAEGKRKGVTATAVPSSQPAAVQKAQPSANGAKEEYQVPNPLPAVSNVLDPYVSTATMGRPAPSSAVAAAAKKNGRGRQQIVHTATHGTLPMAALEDAVFRLLTPATGAPSPPVMQQQPHPAPANSNGIVDPLAPPNKVAVTHTQYHPPAPAPVTAHPQSGPAGMSPTGVADMSLLPSWVDAKNPPAWYNDGSDIDTLLEDADCLNWLSDTGDLEETYPPAMAEPASVTGGVVSSNSSGTTATAIAPTPVGSVQDPTDPTGGVVHPSTDSLSFLVDPPEQSAAMLMAPARVAVVPVPQPQPITSEAVPQNPEEDVNQLPSFLDEELTLNSAAHVNPLPLVPEAHAVAAPAPLPASATEAVESIAPEHKLAGVGESDTNLMGFPDLDMGDEQAFVSALLENSGQSTMSFPKLGSDMHLSQVNIAGVSAVGAGSATEFVVDEHHHALEENP